jgi:hypothetical protein
MEQGGVVEPRADAVEGVRQILEGVEHNRDFLAGELVRNDPCLGAAGDDRLHAVAFRESDRATDLGRTRDIEHDASTRQIPRQRLASGGMQQPVLVLCVR